MLPPVRLASCTAALLGLTLVTAPRAQQGPAGPAGQAGERVPAFSAEIVSRDAGDTVRGLPGRLVFSPAGVGAPAVVRIDTPDIPAGYFLIDGDAGKALFVRPERRIFTDARLSTRLTQIFVPVDPENPCPRWQAAAVDAGVRGVEGAWRCERQPQAASEPAVIHYKLIAPGQPAEDRWVHPVLGLLVRLRTADGVTLSLEHLHPEPHSGGELEVPAGFVRLDPQALFERIRHSDVWVEPPH